MTSEAEKLKDAVERLGGSNEFIHVGDSCTLMIDADTVQIIAPSDSLAPCIHISTGLVSFSEVTITNMANGAAIRTMQEPRPKRGKKKLKVWYASRRAAIKQLSSGDITGQHVGGIDSNTIAGGLGAHVNFMGTMTTAGK